MQPRPTKEEHAAHLRAGTGETCLVCDEKLAGEWTDYNGQIRCSTCGTTYQILGSHLTDEFLSEHGLAKEDVAKSYCDCFTEVPLLRAYWQKKQTPIPFGQYFGGSPIPADQYAAFREWLKANAGRLRPEYEDSFNWERVMA